MHTCQRWLDVKIPRQNTSSCGAPGTPTLMSASRSFKRKLSAPGKRPCARGKSLRTSWRPDARANMNFSTSYRWALYTRQLFMHGRTHAAPCNIVHTLGQKCTVKQSIQREESRQSAVSSSSAEYKGVERVICHCSNRLQHKMQALLNVSD